MKMLCRYLWAALTGLVVYSGTASGAVIYNRTLGTTPAAITNTDPSFLFTNCLNAQGCFGTLGNVNDAPNGNLPNLFTFSFPLTPAEITAVTTTPGTGLLTVIAARDIGHKAADASVDQLIASIEGSALANLFQNTIDTCPAGERGTNYAQTEVCGPNFHTDVQATDSATIAQGAFQAAAADGTIQIVLDPTDTVGRVKIFSVQLQYTTTDVPEPATLGLALLGLAALGFGRRKYRA